MLWLVLLVLLVLLILIPPSAPDVRGSFFQTSKMLEQNLTSLLAKNQFFGCRNPKNWFKISLWLLTGPWTAVVETL